MGGGAADRFVHIWDALTGQAVKRVDTGSPVSNVAWLKDSPELVSFLHIRVVLICSRNSIFDKSEDSVLYSEQVLKYLKVMKCIYNL
jgi:WD40 repeat protein